MLGQQRGPTLPLNNFSKEIRSMNGAVLQRTHRIAQNILQREYPPATDSTQKSRQ